MLLRLLNSLLYLVPVRRDGYCYRYGWYPKTGLVTVERLKENNDAQI